jgi:hypothetical protein
MVYYIRFLNGPAWQTKTSTIVGSIAISSDLRERLLHQTVTLTVSVGDSSASETIEWKPGMHSLKFALKSQPPNERTAVCVSAAQSAVPRVISVCSHLAQRNNFFRDIRLSGCKTLNIAEWKREAIEGHIWYLTIRTHDPANIPGMAVLSLSIKLCKSYRGMARVPRL